MLSLIPQHEPEARPQVYAEAVSRLASVSLAFLILNTAAAMAFLFFVSGKKPTWAR